MGIDFATDWDRETCINELARCYDLLPEDLRKIRGRYLPFCGRMTFLPR